MSAPSPIAARRMMFHGPLRAPGQSNQPAPNDEEYGDDGHGVDCETNDGHDTQDTTPLLPIFSAPHLDSLPVYHLTYDLCLLVASRCETTLTWEQLRSPQVSQFLLKPILQAIHTAHFSRATLYSLMANCLQFRKEADIKPGISGASHTRAMVCELLAIKLLKEYSTRELIDALSYDFHPLQGQTPPSTTSTTAHETGRYPHSRSQRHLKGVRISCLEVAIRAQAKRFLAHPLVVQQLEAIWAGTIVFYSAADHLHRLPLRNATRTQYGSLGASVDPANGAYTDSTSFISRRSASLYDPQDASLFKLSRLRVPRYRQVLSTCSFAVLLCLFLTVIQRRSFLLTTLELVFWFWSAGYMLDEIVGFNEQGFSLYLMSFWNTFDVGILFLLFCYYCLRLYSVLLLDHTVAILAYDVLAATAVLLVPRLFSVLDHYRYFSQLLIAFRMMAVDLFAVLILIIIACSGFFVAFTFSFGHGDSPSSVIYALFQMIMGFTPAAWQLWDRYNPLGKAILILFLFICHFLVVTILITVLTNSFMAIVQNANEENQSYLPIYLYERIALRSAVFEPTDLVDGPLRPSQSKNWVNNGNKGHDLFALGNTFRLREPSIATHQKDEALEQVFRRPFRQTAHRVRQDTRAQHKSNAIVSDWMRDIGPGGIAEPPDEEDQAVLERLEQRRILCFPGARRRLKHSLRDPTITTRSVASDPEDFVNSGKIRPKAPAVERGFGHPLRKQLTQQTDMEGDDELSSDHQQDDEVSSLRQRTTTIGSRIQDEQEDLFNLTNGPSSNSFKGSSRPSTAKRLSRRNSPNRKPNTPRRKHSRNLSSATVLLNPLRSWTTGEVNPMPSGKPALRRAFQRSTPPTPSRSPKEKTAAHTGPRPIHPSKPEAKSVPNLNGVLLSGDFLKLNRGRSSIAIGLGSDLGDNKAVGGGFVGGIPASFATQMAYATGDLQRNRSNTDHRDTLNRLVLARMKTLEESFRDVIREVKDLRREQIYPPDIRGNMASKANIPTSKRQYIEYHSEDGGNNTDLIFDDSSSELKASSV
ncbi:hypothetical protein CISG_04250 [Coccidioides immitis RMSCC 3703]|uniref:Uncharacterized protein n=1 Tax=Coccidioides immitis RMSCC 3703 TaxID=454286 RepID=A0A0J8QTE5_COCIT|nr:hypothetical protein CISG_04250 [Coccidioides immitis RMSCC 3703]